MLKCGSLTNISIEVTWRVLLDNNKKQNKQKMKKKKKEILWKIVLSSFFNFSYKNIHEKVILFHAALSVQKNTRRAGYAERSIK